MILFSLFKDKNFLHELIVWLEQILTVVIKQSPRAQSDMLVLSNQKYNSTLLKVN